MNSDLFGKSVYSSFCVCHVPLTHAALRLRKYLGRFDCVSEEIIARLVMNYFLHRGIKNSDITNLSFELNEANGKYFLDIKSTIVLATKGQSI